VTNKSTVKQNLFFLHFKNQQQLAASYMPFIRGGGLYIPSESIYTLGEQVFLMIRLLNEKEKLAVIGTVVWITPTTRYVGSQLEGQVERSVGRSIERSVGRSIKRQENKKPGIGVRLEDRENKVRNKLAYYLPDKDSGKGLASDKNKALAENTP
jgi:Tfp pilus assembly protein PilZ